MTIAMPPTTDRAGPLDTTLRGAFAQPGDQALPREFLAMLVALDRSKRGAR